MVIKTWVKLSRDILDWEWYHDDNCKAVLLHIILCVRWKKINMGKIQVNEGEMLTTQRELEQALGKSRHEIRTALEALKSSGAIICSPAKGKTLIKVSKYAYFNSYNSNNTNKFRQGFSKDSPPNRQDINNIYNNYNSQEEKKEGNKYNSDYSRTGKKYKYKYGIIL